VLLNKMIERWTWVAFGGMKGTGICWWPVALLRPGICAGWAISRTPLPVPGPVPGSVPTWQEQPERHRQG
jgi:hypothetical protein